MCFRFGTAVTAGNSPPSGDFGRQTDRDETAAEHTRPRV